MFRHLLSTQCCQVGCSKIWKTLKKLPIYRNLLLKKFQEPGFPKPKLKFPITRVSSSNLGENLHTWQLLYQLLNVGWLCGVLPLGQIWWFHQSVIERNVQNLDVTMGCHLPPHQSTLSIRQLVNVREWWIWFIEKLIFFLLLLLLII